LRTENNKLGLNGSIHSSISQPQIIVDDEIG